MVEALRSLQSLGQLPSQVSLVPTMVSPQNAEQSVSLPWLQPAGQQPSPLTQVVIAWNEHTAEQFSALPVSVSTVQATPSLQPVGQLPSQLAPPSCVPLSQQAGPAGA